MGMRQEASAPPRDFYRTDTRQALSIITGEGEMIKMRYRYPGLMAFYNMITMSIKGPGCSRSEYVWTRAEENFEALLVDTSGKFDGLIKDIIHEMEQDIEIRITPYCYKVLRLYPIRHLPMLMLFIASHMSSYKNPTGSGYALDRTMYGVAQHNYIRIEKTKNDQNDDLMIIPELMINPNFKYFGGGIVIIDDIPDTIITALKGECINKIVSSEILPPAKIVTIFKKRNDQKGQNSDHFFLNTDGKDFVPMSISKCIELCDRD